MWNRLLRALGLHDRDEDIKAFWRAMADSQWRAGHYRVLHYPDWRSVRFPDGSVLDVDFGIKTILFNQYGHPDAIAPAFRMIVE